MSSGNGFSENLVLRNIGNHPLECEVGKRQMGFPQLWIFSERPPSEFDSEVLKMSRKSVDDIFLELMIIVDQAEFNYCRRTKGLNKSKEIEYARRLTVQ